MKRLIYAIVAIALLLCMTLYSKFTVKQHCTNTLNELKQFKTHVISGDTLTKTWSNRKEKMSAFVNHDFLDQISIYIGQITLGESNKDQNFAVAYKNVETLLSMIIDEQQLDEHSFY